MPRVAECGFAILVAGEMGKGSGMVSVSLLHEVIYAFMVSAVLIWLQIRGVGIGGRIVTTLVACIAILAIQLFTSGHLVVSRLAIQVWLLFVLLPCMAVYAVSRMAWVPHHPLWLLLVGPLAFIVAVLLVMVAYNIAFASRPVR